MSHLSTPRRRLTCFGLALAFLALPATVIAARLLSPDALLERAYAPALARSELLWPEPAESPASLKPVSLPAVTALRKPFAVGDRMVIDSRDGGTEAMQVIAIEQLDGAGLGLNGVSLQMVTARPDGAASGASVRFLFAVDTAQPQPKPDRVL